MQRYIRIRFLVFIPSISTCSTDFSIFPPQRIINFVALVSGVGFRTLTRANLLDYNFG